MMKGTDDLDYSRLIPENFDAVLVTTPVNRRYFGGLYWDDGFFIITREGSFLCSDSRCYESAERVALLKGTEPVLIKSYRNFLHEFFAQRGLKSVVCESEISVGMLNNLNKNHKGIKYAVSDEFDKSVRDLRRHKSPDEINCIKKAQNIAEEALKRVVDRAEIGMTEAEFALDLEFEMRKAGSKGVAFDTIAISGKNTSVPHGVPTQKPFEKGDLLTVDFGGVFEGYRSDMTRTFVFGEPSKEAERIYNTVLRAQKSALEKIKCGMNCRDADKICRDIIAEKGYGQYFTHSTGHGVGLDIHEYPNLSPLSVETLQPGDVVTVEPGIYITGNMGVRIEDMLYITEDKAENLTHYPKELSQMIIGG